MTSLTGWNQVFRIGVRRWGVVTIHDARGAGISDSSFHDRRRREGWHVFARGVALLPGFPITLAARRFAALLACGDGATLSHGTALALHGFDTRLPQPPMVDVVIPHARVVKPPPGVRLHRTRRLEPLDRTEVDGLLVTTVARTVVDVAGLLPRWRVEGLALHARQRRLLDTSQLQDQVNRRRGLRGLGKARQACTLLAGDHSDSILERRTRDVLHAGGLNPTDQPHPVKCVEGTLLVDMAFPDAHVAVECDGRTFHSSKRAFERDRRRWDMLQDAGWEIIWVTWDRLHSEPQAIVDRVRRATGQGPGEAA